MAQDLAVKVDALQRFTQDDVGQLRADVDVLLNERTQQEQAKNAPVDWAALTEDQAAAQWPIGQHRQRAHRQRRGSGGAGSGQSCP